jgi:hypothetical protein
VPLESASENCIVLDCTDWPKVKETDVDVGTFVFPDVGRTLVTVVGVTGTEKTTSTQ